MGAGLGAGAAAGGGDGEGVATGEGAATGEGVAADADAAAATGAATGVGVTGGGEGDAAAGSTAGAALTMVGDSPLPPPHAERTATKTSGIGTDLHIVFTLIPFGVFVWESGDSRAHSIGLYRRFTTGRTDVWHVHEARWLSWRVHAQIS